MSAGGLTMRERERKKEAQLLVPPLIFHATVVSRQEQLSVIKALLPENPLPPDLFYLLTGSEAVLCCSLLSCYCHSLERKTEGD